MDFTSIFMAMIKLFLILLTGFLCHKLRVFPEGTQDVITKLVLYVTAPCTILYSVLSGDQLPTGRTMAELLLCACITYAIAITLGALAPRLMGVARDRRGIYSAMLVFSNSGFMGYPVVATLFGDGAVFHAAVFNLPFFLLLYTVGVIFLSRDGALRGGSGSKPKMKLSQILSPCFVASILALVLAVTALRFPAVITDTIGMLGNLTTPGSLLVIGISIAKMPRRAVLGTPRLYLMSILRLMVIPGIIYLILSLFIHDTLVLGVALVISAMPVAALVAMLAKEHGADADTVTQGVFISTVLSVITIPILVSILM